MRRTSRLLFLAAPLVVAPAASADDTAGRPVLVSPEQDGRRMTVQPESGQVEFGDGATGRRPAAGTPNVRGTYRAGQGAGPEPPSRVRGIQPGAKPGLGSAADRPYGTAPAGRLATPVERSFGLTGECALGFAKAQKPDHPAGFYECRLPAGPACAKGYDYQDAFDDPAPPRFQYRCQEWYETDPWKCPQGWTKGGSSSDYTCTSGVLACASGHRVDGVGRTGPTASPTPHHGGTGTAVYTYRCTAE